MVNKTFHLCNKNRLFVLNDNMIPCHNYKKPSLEIAETTLTQKTRETRKYMPLLFIISNPDLLLTDSTW